MGKAERTIQDACMEYLGMHPRVAFVHTTTTGNLAIKGGYRIKVGYPGMGDIIGMLKDGRFLSVEVKQPGETPTDDQYAFMRMINGARGFACWVDSLDMLREAIGEKDKTKALK